MKRYYQYLKTKIIRFCTRFNIQSTSSYNNQTANKAETRSIVERRIGKKYVTEADKELRRERISKMFSD